MLCLQDVESWLSLALQGIDKSHQFNGGARTERLIASSRAPPSATDERDLDIPADPRGKCMGGGGHGSGCQEVPSAVHLHSTDEASSLFQIRPFAFNPIDSESPAVISLKQGEAQRDVDSCPQWDE